MFLRAMAVHSSMWDRRRHRLYVTGRGHSGGELRFEGERLMMGGAGGVGLV